MRKNVIALMLVLPLLFVFAVFSAVKTASLGVHVSASGIEIMGKPAGGTLTLDLAQYRNDYEFAVEVKPAAASNRAYDYLIEPVGDSELADIQVEGDRLVANSVGMARVVAQSRDGAHRDSITVVVSSSKPYDFTFSLSNGANGANLLREEGGRYTAELSTGSYSYRAALLPAGYTSPRITPAEGYEDAVIIDEAAAKILLPFSGKAAFEVTMPAGVRGDITKRVELEVAAQPTESFLVNGGTEEHFNLGVIEENSGELHRSERTSVYVELADPTDSLSQVQAPYSVTSTIVPLGVGRYRVDLLFEDTVNNPTAEVVVSTKKGSARTLIFRFEAFRFTLRTEIGSHAEDAENAYLLLNTPISFYAVPQVEANGMAYVWEITTPAGMLLAPEDYADTVLLDVNDDGTICTVTALAYNSFTLRVKAAYRVEGELRPYNSISPVNVPVSVIRRVSAIQMVYGESKAYDSLAGRLTVAGYEYDGTSLDMVPAEHVVEVVAYDGNAPISGISDLKFISSDENVASVRISNGRALLTPEGEGEVTVTVEWQGNESFLQNVRTSVTYNVAPTAVRVTTSPQLYDATRRNRAVVLGADIMLGTNSAGGRLAAEELRGMLGELQSTFNTEYYKNNGRLAEATVRYALEFTNDVYGNGYTLNAENFTNAKDGSDQPLFFRGPLSLVEYGIAASVAAQDNIAFLCRKDGVTLYNVVLLGCSDESLMGGQGSYDLEALNNVGTTLEINANVNVLNCRVRNGRNVVRVYGGNRDGSRYFIDSLDEINPERGVEAERIHVRIEGCILSQGREFLLKIGANRALRASSLLGGDINSRVEPDLLNEAGKPYAFQTNGLLDDAYFYKMYVVTDVTLKDSVLETSGLFTVGVESNFAGRALSSEFAYGSAFSGWSGTGGTSFASVLRLEGDIRLYDWKDLSLINSDTLISTTLEELKLNIADMLEFVTRRYPEKYGNLIAREGNLRYVHGGIAFYGGGKNYSQLDLRGIDETLSDFSESYINIEVLGEGEGSTGYQGEILPLAAGTQDFRFYMYGIDSRNGYQKQTEDAASGMKYKGIKQVYAFG